MPNTPYFPAGADLRPFTQDTRLCRFLVLPTALLRWGVSPGAVLVYALLLDRAKLSQRSGWTDQRGWVYTVFPIQDLCQALGRGTSTVKRWLRELEGWDLIFRTRPLPGGKSWTFLQVPKYSVVGEGPEEAHQVRDPWEETAWTPRPGQPTKADIDRMFRTLTAELSTPQAESGPGPDLADPRPNLAGGGAESGPLFK